MKRTEYTISEIDADFDYEFENVENIDAETPENTTPIATFANTFDEFHSDFEVLTGMDENTFEEKAIEVEKGLGEVFHKVVVYTDDSDLVKVEWFVNNDKKELALSIIAHSDDKEGGSYTYNQIVEGTIKADCIFEESREVMNGYGQDGRNAFLVYKASETLFVAVIDESFGDTTTRLFDDESEAFDYIKGQVKDYDEA